MSSNCVGIRIGVCISKSGRTTRPTLLPLEVIVNYQTDSRGWAGGGGGGGGTWDFPLSPTPKTINLSAPIFKHCQQEYIMKREYRTPHSPIGNTLGKVT